MSSGVGGVLVDVGGGEVGGQDDHRLRAGGQVHGDRDVLRGQVHLGAFVAGGAVTADPHAVDGDVQPVRLEGRVGGPGRGQDPAPVRVLAADVALDQVPPGYGPAHRDR